MVVMEVLHHRFDFVPPAHQAGASGHPRPHGTNHASKCKSRGGASTPTVAQPVSCSPKTKNVPHAGITCHAGHGLVHHAGHRQPRHFRLEKFAPRKVAFRKGFRLLEVARPSCPSWRGRTKQQPNCQPSSASHTSTPTPKPHRSVTGFQPDAVPPISGSSSAKPSSLWAKSRCSSGVSELTMACVMNGMALHGGVIPACGTFFVFRLHETGCATVGADASTRDLHLDA